MPDKEKPSETGVADILKDFFNTSSITGAPHLVHESKPRRIFWGFLILTMFIDVTICPENPLKSKIEANITHIKFLWKQLLINKLAFDDETADELAHTKAIQVNRGYAGTIVKNLFDMAPHIISCSYRGRKCNRKHILPPNMYGCITIMPEKREVVNSNGKIGLLLIMSYSAGVPFLENDQMEAMSPSYKLIVHPKNTPPNFDRRESMVILEKGKMNHIEVTMHKYSDIPTFNRPCEQIDENATEYWIDDLLNPITFLMDKRMCTSFAFQKKLFSQCECYDDAKWVPLTKAPLRLCSRLPPNIYDGSALVGPEKTLLFRKSGNVKFEDSQIGQELLSRMLCLKRFTIDNPPRMLSECPKRACNETNYEMQLTVRNYNDIDAKIMTQKFGTETKYKDDFVIQLSAGNTEIVENYETLSYDYSNLMSDIGGQMAVWISCSIITVFEFVELVVRLLYHCCKKCCCCFCRRSKKEEDECIQLEEKT